MLKALGRLMDSAGFDVEKFSDPVTFLARLEQATCRLAVLDVWMPQMSGLEVQTRLRRDSPATQIIFLTGRDDPMARQTAIEAGAFAFLSKPFDDEVLMQLIREALAGRTFCNAERLIPLVLPKPAFASTGVCATRLQPGTCRSLSP